MLWPQWTSALTAFSGTPELENKDKGSITHVWDVEKVCTRRNGGTSKTEKFTASCALSATKPAEMEDIEAAKQRAHAMAALAEGIDPKKLAEPVSL